MKHINELAWKLCAMGGPRRTEQRYTLAYEFAEGKIQYGIWESGPGTLDLTFEWDETVYAVEGEVDVINVATGEHHRLTPGSLMIFSRGSTWTWNIPVRFRKLFTLVELP